MLFSFSLLVLGFACSTTPESCEELCLAAEELTANCLEGWELDWNAAGYANAQDFQNSCSTWAWEQEQLIEAAQKRGEKTADLASVCEERSKILSADTASCTDMGLWGEEL